MDHFQTLLFFLRWLCSFRFPAYLFPLSRLSITVITCCNFQAFVLLLIESKRKKSGRSTLGSDNDGKKGLSCQIRVRQEEDRHRFMRASIAKNGNKRVASRALRDARPSFRRAKVVMGTRDCVCDSSSVVRLRKYGTNTQVQRPSVTLIWTVIAKPAAPRLNSDSRSCDRRRNCCSDLKPFMFGLVFCSFFRIEFSVTSVERSLITGSENVGGGGRVSPRVAIYLS